MGGLFAGEKRERRRDFVPAFDPGDHGERLSRAPGSLAAFARGDVSSFIDRNFMPIVGYFRSGFCSLSYEKIRPQFLSFIALFSEFNFNLLWKCVIDPQI